MTNDGVILHIYRSADPLSKVLWTLGDDDEMIISRVSSGTALRGQTQGREQVFRPGRLLNLVRLCAYDVYVLSADEDLIKVCFYFS